MNMNTECIVLIDTSYFSKYSANAAWRKLKDDFNFIEDENFDPMTIQEYREAYSGYFLFGLDEIIGRHFPIHSGSNFVFCMDSKRSDIWRKSIFPGYKHQRDLAKKKFSYKNINDWTERYVKSHNVERGSRYIKVNGAEADDIFKVIIDREEDDFYIGRTEFDSPDVDGEVLITKTKQLTTGDFYQVKIIESDMYDLYAEVI